MDYGLSMCATWLHARFLKFHRFSAEMLTQLEKARLRAHKHDISFDVHMETSARHRVALASPWLNLARGAAHWPVAFVSLSLVALHALPGEAIGA